jgi:hypothetical protein
MVLRYVGESRTMDKRPFDVTGFALTGLALGP